MPTSLFNEKEMTTQQRTIYLVPARVAARPVVASRTVIPVSRAPFHQPQQHAIRRVQQAPNTQRPVTPLKRATCVSPPAEYDPLEDLLNEGSGQGPPRKRERLNHLSAEEKMNRRKLKNRVAAQTARDRKKARSQRMEEVVRQLLEENQRLREENNRLRTEQQQKIEAAVESAAFISGPLPRVQVASLLPFLLLLTSFLKTNSTASSRNSRKTLISTNLRVSCRTSRKPTKRRSLWRAPLSRPPRPWDVP